MILGLMSGEQLASSWSETARREVFYRNPTGKFPLGGLLSLQDTEESDKSTFGWWEDRLVMPTGLTAAANAAGPFTESGNTTDQSDGFNLAAGGSFRVYMASTDNFRERDVIWIRNCPNAAASAKLQIKGVVTDIDHDNDFVIVRALEAVTSISNAADAVGLTVFYIGSAAGEGVRSRTGSMTVPIEISNYTQITRTAFEFTRNAVKAGVRWDKEGVYKTKKRDAAVRHMIGLELMNLWGVRRVDTIVNEEGQSVPEKKCGGIEWFLKQYELGNTGNGGVFDYRPGGSDITSSTWTTTEEKRIIDVNGTLSVDEFELLVERAFKYNGDSSNEKLVLCGNGFISRFNKVVRMQSLVTTMLNPKEESYGMSMTRWESPWGTLLFKTHPLFNENAAFTNSAFILDIGSMSQIPLTDSDTELLKNRQNNDFDGRKDEFLTECGLRLKYPERHMFINNVTGVTA
mgnify:CR=1 FL=1